MLQLQSAFGVFALLGIAWALGENRRHVSIRQAAIGLAATLLTAAVLLKLPVVAHAFGAINDAVNVISAASRAGRAARRGLVGRRGVDTEGDRDASEDPLEHGGDRFIAELRVRRQDQPVLDDGGEQSPDVIWKNHVAAL